MTTFCPKCRTTPCTCARGGAFGLQPAKGSIRSSGSMNKTEAAFERHLQALLLAGEILWFRFQGMTFRIGDDCRFTPDFNVMLADGTLRMIDTKGTKTAAGRSKPYIEEDARVKIRTAPQIFPIRFAVAYKTADGWKIEDF